MHRSSLAVCCVFTLGLAAMQSPVRAQTTIPDKVSCAGCTIRQQRIATIGRFGEPGEIPGMPGMVLGDPKGNYIAFTKWDEPPSLYDGKGKFVRLVGKRGEGPGEFRSVVGGFVTPGDSVVLLDAVLQRASIFAPNLSFKRMVSVPLQLVGAAPVAWPDVIGSGVGRTAGVVRRRVHELSLSGNVAAVRRSIVISDQPADPMKNQVDNHVFSNIANGRFWTSPTSAYLLTEFDRTRATGRVVQRTPEWFPPFSDVSLGSFEKPPAARIVSLHTDAEGLIWVVLGVPAPTWKQAWPANARDILEFSIDQIARHLLYRTRIEVIDPRTSTLVAAADLPHPPIPGLQDGRIAFYHEDKDGAPVLEVMRLTLQRK